MSMMLPKLVMLVIFLIAGMQLFWVLLLLHIVWAGKSGRDVVWKVLAIV